jgi:hypothetical protein
MKWINISILDINITGSWTQFVVPSSFSMQIHNCRLVFKIEWPKHKLKQILWLLPLGKYNGVGFPSPHLIKDSRGAHVPRQRKVTGMLLWLRNQSNFLQDAPQYLYKCWWFTVCHCWTNSWCIILSNVLKECLNIQSSTEAMKLLNFEPTLFFDFCSLFPFTETL